LIAISAGCLAVAAWFYLQCFVAPATSYLPSHGPGEWITFPFHATLDAQRPAAIPADFTRSFELSAVPSSATLRCAALRGYELFLNGQQISDAAAANENLWKQPRNWNLAPHLRIGPNQLLARVRNSSGPPAWWCVLDLDSQQIVSDPRWQIEWSGTHTLAARSAVTVPSRRELDPVAWQDRRFGPTEESASTTPWHQFARRPATILAIVVLAIAAAIWLERQNPSLWTSRWWWYGAAGLWVALFLNNASQLRVAAGFDGVHHLAYVQYLLDEGRLPSATDGFQMYQPPLYHSLVALLLKISGTSTADAAAGIIIRLLGLLLGIAQIGLIYASLKLLFPQHPRRWVIGLLVAAALPVQLYLYHYITNEALLTTLLTASLYLTLRALQQRHNPTWIFVLLGLSLGAALLTKVTAVLVLPLVFGALATRLIVERRGDASRWWQMIVLPAVLCLALGGWVYARTYLEHGKLVVTNTDDTFRFWQWPGFRTAADASPTTAAFAQPFFAGFVSLWDGLYSSLWGDGLLGGELDPRLRPPWNYELMSIGYLAALIPTLFLLAGFGMTLRTWLAQPEANGFLLLGALAAASFALLAMSLHWPFYSMPRAFYGLLAALSFSALVAVGFDRLAGVHPVRSIILTTLLLAWAITSYVSFWVPRSSLTRTLRGFRALVEQRADEALTYFDLAIGGEPENGLAHFGRGLALDGLNQPAAADTEYQAAAQLTPDDPEVWIRLAETAQRRGDDQETVADYLETATTRAPHSLRAWLRHGEFLSSHNPSAAIDALRTALDLAPGSGEARFRLAPLLDRPGQRSLAAAQWEAAAMLDFQPAESLLRSGIAWAEDNQPQRAIHAYQAALARDPRFKAEAAKRLSTAYLALDDMASALEWAHQAAAANPQDAAAHWALGRALLREGSTSLGISSLRTALRIDPNSPAIVTLAWVLATDPEDRFRRPEEALQLAQRATEQIFPQDPRAWDALAAAHAAGGDFERATRAITQALGLAEAQLSTPALVAELTARRDQYQRSEPLRLKPGRELPGRND